MSRGIIVSNWIVVGVSVPIPRLRSLGGGWYNGIRLNETSEFGVVSPGAVVYQLNVTVIALAGEFVVRAEGTRGAAQFAKGFVERSGADRPVCVRGEGSAAEVVREEVF